MSVFYDAGVFVGADRDDREIWAEHKVRLEAGLVPIATSPVVAQVSRSARQVSFRRFLRGCEVVPFSPDDAHDVGNLLGKAGTSDVVDAHVVVVASKLRSTIITGDVSDLERLSEELFNPIIVKHL